MPPVKRVKVNNVSSNYLTLFEYHRLVIFLFVVAYTDSKVNSNDVPHVLSTPVASSPETLLAYLGDATELLNAVWPSASQASEEQDESQKMLHTFTKIYRAHYDKIIKALSTLNFQDIESIWTCFWQCSSDSDSAGIWLLIIIIIYYFYLTHVIVFDIYRLFEHRLHERTDQDHIF